MRANPHETQANDVPAALVFVYKYFKDTISLNLGVRSLTGKHLIDSVRSTPAL